jgi:hypothetical protein
MARRHSVKCQRCNAKIKWDNEGLAKIHGARTSRGTVVGPPCPVSRVEVAYLDDEGEWRPRDTALIADDVQAKLDAAKARDLASPPPGPRVVEASESIRTVSGGLPGLGKGR